MGTVTFKLDAEEGKAVAGFLKIIDAQKKVEDAQGRINRKGKEHDDGMAKMGQAATQQLTSMVAGWFTVSTAIHAAQRAVKMLGDEQERLHKQSEGYTKSLIQQLAGQGDLARWPQIDAFLRGKAFEGTGATVPERQATMAAVRSSLPLADWSVIEPLTMMAATAGLAGYDRPRFGQRAADLAQILPARNQQEVARIGNLAAFTTAAEGRYGSKFDEKGMRAIQQFVAMGMGTPEQGIGYALASLATKQGTTGISDLVTALTEHKEFPDFAGKPLTANERLQRRFNAADMRTRQEMLKDTKVQEAVLGTRAASYRAMMQARPGDLAAQALQAETSGLLGADIAAAMANPKWAAQQGTAALIGRAESKELSMADRMQLVDAADAMARSREENVILRNVNKFFMTLDALFDWHNKGLEEAAEPLRRASENLEESSRKITNPNVHVEPSGGGQ